jgi:hypothetical protein
LSVAVVVNVTAAVAEPGAVDVVMSAGHVITGGTVSSTVNTIRLPCSFPDG